MCGIWKGAKGTSLRRLLHESLRMRRTLTQEESIEGELSAEEAREDSPLIDRQTRRALEDLMVHRSHRRHSKCQHLEVSVLSPTGSWTWIILG
jgi:hypothetical protein